MAYLRPPTMTLPPSYRISCLLAALAAGAAFGQDPPRQLAELADLSLEQLTRITVTSASRREEALSEVPASLFVITHDDIRRSGATSIPEALRMAPNLHVARADANQYVIGARGFGNILSNKLLVLIDGRTVYTPLFSGVFWEAQDTLLGDIERIEVISGPGATLWGANAVNGVISIITKAAADTQGTVVNAGAGNDDRIARVRHGGTWGSDGQYRVHLKYTDRDSWRTADGAGIADDGRMLSGGLRADWSGPARRVTVLADAYRGEIGGGPLREFSGASLLGRLARDLGAGSRLHLQAYYDRTDRRHQQTFDENLDTFDLEINHSTAPRPGHRVVWGGGYRHSRDRVGNSATQAFIPPERTLRYGNVFVQDTIEVAPRVAATLGIKTERNPYTGSEWLPNLRVAWSSSPDALVWAALSRAVRAPSRIDRELFIPGAPPFLLAGSGQFESEVANVIELGYRTQASATASFSATLYHHDYPNLRSIGLVGSTPAFRNDIEGRVSGIEGWGSWRATPEWRLSGGFVVQEIVRRVIEGRVDLGGMAALGNDPERMGLLRSTWSPTPAHDVDVAMRYVGKLQAAVPSYTAVDARFAWRPTNAFELSLTVRNALDREHYEWQNRGLSERSYLLNLRWSS